MEAVIPDALAGERLDRAVAFVTGWSRRDVALAVSAGAVRVDGVPASLRSRRVVSGQRLTIDDTARPEPRPPVVPDIEVDIDVVYADDDLIVIDKPAGRVVHPAPGHPGATLVNGLLARFPEIVDVGQAGRPGIVHRLDRGTSGLMVVARSARAYDALVDALSSHDVDRRYVALVFGHPKDSYGAVEAPIGRSRRNPLKMAVVADGKWALTRYRVGAIHDEPATALLNVELETGRTHQIRVHLARLGHPVVGDDLYGGKRPSLVAPRPMLHAAALRFAHPAHGRTVEFTTPVPPDMETVLSSRMPLGG